MGPYEFLEELGRGGFGTVHKVKHKQTGELFAAKVPHKDVSSQFFREISILQGLTHPHIIVFRGAELDENPPYYVMEYASNGSLEEKIQKRLSDIPWEGTIKVINNVLSALEYAHELDIIHGDIKPSNILLDKENIVKLSDFGLARIITEQAMKHSLGSSTKYIIGTLQYMSQEQQQGKIDPRNDLYSVGVILYQLLTGQLPTGLRLPSSLNPEIPKDFDRVVARALDTIDHRYQTAEEFQNDLRNISENLSTSVEEFKSPDPAAVRAYTRQLVQESKTKKKSRRARSDVDDRSERQSEYKSTGELSFDGFLKEMQGCARKKAEEEQKKNDRGEGLTVDQLLQRMPKTKRQPRKISESTVSIGVEERSNEPVTKTKRIGLFSKIVRGIAISGVLVSGIFGIPAIIRSNYDSAMNNELTTEQVEPALPIERTIEEYASMFEEAKQAVDDKDIPHARDLIEELQLGLTTYQPEEELIDQVRTYNSQVVQPAVRTWDEEQQRLRGYNESIGSIRNLISDHQYEEADREIGRLRRRMGDTPFYLVDTQDLVQDIDIVTDHNQALLTRLQAHRNQFIGLRRRILDLTTGYGPHLENMDKIEQYRQVTSDAEELANTLEEEGNFPQLLSEVNATSRDHRLTVEHINRYIELFDNREQQYEDIERDFQENRLINAKFRCETFLGELRSEQGEARQIHFGGGFFRNIPAIEQLYGNLIQRTSELHNRILERIGE